MTKSCRSGSRSERPQKASRSARLTLVAVDRAADLAADRDAEPHVLALLVTARKGVEDEIAGRMG